MFDVAIALVEKSEYSPVPERVAGGVRRTARAPINKQKNRRERGRATPRVRANRGVIMGAILRCGPLKKKGIASSTMLSL
jgi:hypothetical protein